MAFMAPMSYSLLIVLLLSVVVPKGIVGRLGHEVMLKYHSLFWNGEMHCNNQIENQNTLMYILNYL